jgi:hypothetical protein
MQIKSSQFLQIVVFILTQIRNIFNWVLGIVITSLGIFIFIFGSHAIMGDLEGAKDAALHLIKTPILIFSDAVGTFKEYPINVLIWVGILVWQIRKLCIFLKKKKALN